MPLNVEGAQETNTRYVCAISLLSGAYFQKTTTKQINEVKADPNFPKN
jgi:hypothetical protein